MNPAVLTLDDPENDAATTTSDADTHHAPTPATLQFTVLGPFWKTNNNNNPPSIDTAAPPAGVPPQLWSAFQRQLSEGRRWTVRGLFLVCLIVSFIAVFGIKRLWWDEVASHDRFEDSNNNNDNDEETVEAVTQDLSNAIAAVLALHLALILTLALEGAIFAGTVRAKVATWRWRLQPLGWKADFATDGYVLFVHGILILQHHQQPMKDYEAPAMAMMELNPVV